VTDLHIGLLGPLCVTAGTEEIAVNGPKQKVILAALTLARGRPVSIDDLLETVWGEELPATARNSLQYHVTALRKALAGGATALTTRDPGYALEATSDVAAFTRHVEAGHQATADGDHQTASAELTAGLNLWRGPALADLREFEITAARATSLEEQRLACVEAWAEAELACGRAEPMLAPLREMIGENPTRERLWEQLMLALYRTGRQEAALSAYRSVRGVLDRELGVEPSGRLQSLHQAILRQDPGLKPLSMLRPRPGPALSRTTLVRSVVARPQPTLTAPGGVRVPLADDLVVMGRQSGCGLVLEDDQASRRHAQVVPTDAGYELEDLGSTNGTYLNGERLTRPTLLCHGDRIEVGHTVVKFLDPTL
jgi:SARP family transcriptional regulator, regulator of embCAB operon